ncbi:MAG TPA: GH-E family nuclease [Anoxybacillus sp.]|nr:GH-E family nuclease [Anoxybacillus sp.]
MKKRTFDQEYKIQAELFWDKSKPKAGQWDMGHTPENKYSVWHKKYIKGEIIKEND